MLSTALFGCWAAACVAPSLALGFAASGQPGADSPVGNRAERFVQEARVVAMRSVGSGATKPRQAVLRLGRETRRGVWKTVGGDDPFAQSAAAADGGARSSYRHEIAAYETSRLLGLDLVPATAERRIGRRTGSLQLWLEGATRLDNLDPKALGPGRQSQLAELHLFRRLIASAPDSDILESEGGALFSIDHSGAFAPTSAASANARRLARFTRRSVDALSRMDRDLVEKHLARWLLEDELEALLQRRNEILRWVAEQVGREGENGTFLP